MMPDMARADERKTTLRLTEEEFGVFDRAASDLGVETGGLIRAAASQGLVGAVREVSAGRVRLRRRSGVPVSLDAVVVERPAVRGVPSAAPTDAAVERARLLSRAEAFRAASARGSR